MIPPLLCSADCLHCPLRLNKWIVPVCLNTSKSTNKWNLDCYVLSFSALPSCLIGSMANYPYLPVWSGRKLLLTRFSVLSQQRADTVWCWFLFIFTGVLSVCKNRSRSITLSLVALSVCEDMLHHLVNLRYNLNLPMPKHFHLKEWSYIALRFYLTFVLIRCLNVILQT